MGWNIPRSWFAGLVTLLALVVLPGLLEVVPAQSIPNEQWPITYPGQDSLAEHPIIEFANPVLGIRDRCVTCHNFESYADLPDPRVESTWKPSAGLEADSVAGEERWLVGGKHPGGWLNWHPPQEFGCTICHGGKGLALDYAAAGHPGAGEAASRLNPMLSSVEMQARCGACHPGDYVPGAEAVWRGRILIRELNCAACHSVSPNLAGAHLGPSLARVGEKLTRSQVAAYPNHYHEWVENSRMPEFRIPQVTAWLIASYLVPEASGPVYEADSRFSPTEEKMQVGLELVTNARCANCHVLPRPLAPGGTGGPPVTEDTTKLPVAVADKAPDPLWDLPQGKIGPDLTHIAARVAPGWVLDYLENPHAWYPETRMPRYELSEEELIPLVAWLFETSRQQDRAQVLGSQQRLEPKELAGYSEAKKYELGQQEFVSLGCKGCHDSGADAVPWRTIAPSLRRIGNLNLELLPKLNHPLASLEDYFIRKLDQPGFNDPSSTMPRYDLSDVEHRQIAAALLAEREAPSPNYIKRRRITRSTTGPGRSQPRVQAPPG